MRITQARIRHFRSVYDLSLGLGAVSAICGPNSAGKSNVLRAIEFAFLSEISRDDIYANLPRDLRDQAGGPLLSIYIDLDLANVTPAVAALAGVATGESTNYSFRAVRSGTVTRKLGANTLDDIRELTEHFAVVYVPPIRDLSGHGLDPFRALFSDALRRSRGSRSLRPSETAARRVLMDRANSLLRDQRRVAESLLQADSLGVDTDGVSLDQLYEQVSLTVTRGEVNEPLSDLGTGHQSAVVVNLYRQLGEQTPGETLLLLEEPDNHLHPSTVRAVASDLVALGQTTQVIVTTHSPVLLAALGLRRAKPLHSLNRRTTSRHLDLSHLDEAEVRRTLNQFNLRATEPLVSGGVVLCEGPLDAAVVSALIELDRGSSPDELGLSIIPAGGKHALVTLAGFLTALGADWTAVLDWDAALDDEVSRLRDQLTPAQTSEALASIPALLSVLDSSRRRGRRLSRGLEAVAEELNNGRVEPTIFTGSPLENLARLKGASLEKQKRLTRALRNQSMLRYQGILGELGLWLWSGQIEDVLLQRDGSLDTLEQALIAAGLISSTIPITNREARLKKILKRLASRPSVVAQVVRALREGGHFNYTQVNRALKVLARGS